MNTQMQKEIFSQRNLINKLKKEFIKNDKIDFCINGFNFNSLKFIASGSSYNAIRLGAKFFEKYTKKIIAFDFSSEFISNETQKINSKTLYVFMSQSGETYDTKCALDFVKSKGGVSLAFVNNDNSSIYNNADFQININAGKENSVAATKSFLSGVILLWLFAFYCGQSYEIEKIKSELSEANKAINKTLLTNKQIDPIAKKISKTKRLSLIGYNYGYILAKEGALKIKETSYIDAAAYPTGEFLHGHSAVLNKNKTLIEIFTKKHTAFEKNTIEKIKADFHPRVIILTDEKTENKNAIIFNSYSSDIAKISAVTVTLQLLALKTALLLNKNPDKPAGLNKILNKI